MVVSLTTMPTRTTALRGRSEPLAVGKFHYVNRNRIVPPFPREMDVAMFGMGCFWGAEQTFWETEGVYSTHVGYSGGFTENPTYEEVCTGKTGHAEVVRVVFDPRQTRYDRLLEIFWTHHDPTQFMRQGIDVGAQYRSAIFVLNARQREAATTAKAALGAALAASNKIVRTEIRIAGAFYYAEEYHQQYLARHTEVACKVR